MTANWIIGFQDMAEDTFADSSSHSWLLGNLLILESYVHTLRQSLADRGRTVSDVCQEALDVLWDYLEDKMRHMIFRILPIIFMLLLSIIM